MVGRPRIVIAAAFSTAVVGGGLVLASQQGRGASSEKGSLVTADRGEVAVTVGGIGHITTLTAAAQLAVPSSPSSGGGGAAAAGGAAGATGAGATAGGTTGAGATAGSAARGAGGGATGGGGVGAGGSAPSGSGATPAPADATFPAMAGRVSQLLVRTGNTVVAGQPVATLSDDGTTAATVLQARNDLDTARLELAQRSVQDPTRGPPPTFPEMRAGRQGVATAQAKLQRVLAPPLPADVATARLDLAKAMADLRVARAGTPAAVSAAELAVTAAQQKLRTLTGAPDAAELATAQLELAKAHLDQQTLFVNSPVPTFAERTAAQLAVTAAQAKLDRLIHPPPDVVSAVRAEVAKAEADLAALRATRVGAGLSAARAAVTAARAKLRQLTSPALSDVVAAARLDLRKAQADLAVLRQRGGPAGFTDLAVARLKVDVSSQRLALAEELASRRTVVAAATGTVTSVLTAQGAPVDATTPLMRVQDLSHLVVALDLSEFDVARTQVGAAARVSIDALGGRRYSGSVLDVALNGNETGGVVNFPVIVALDSAGALRPGMSASARIVVSSRPGVVRLPLAAVRDRADHPSVMVRGPSGALVRRPVQLGLADPQFVEVRSGLRAGERVMAPAGGGG